MRRTWLPQAVACVLLLWALYPGNPYAYYVLLRWACCAAFAYLAVQAFERNQRRWVWVLGVTAALYNPIAPAHLTREIWSVINVMTVAIAVASIFGIKQRVNDDTT